MEPRRPRPAVTVGAGIFLSRLSGFARDVAIAAFFGTGIAADAYAAALRIPNVLRNLLGEGTLSASFIPVYSRLLGRRSDSDARRLASNVLTLLLLLAAALSGLGVLAAPWLTRLVVPGWSAESVRLTSSLVRILFPMAGFMILAAWCLGVLNSHRRFFLSFAAPTVWNLSQIAGLLIAWKAGWTPLVIALAWSTVIGAALQFLIQLPTARRLTGVLKPGLSLAWAPLNRVVSNFGPVMVGAGVTQISSFLDVVLASFLTHGAVATLYFSQRLYLLPVSLFGVSVAAASLPELSREAELEERDALLARLRSSFRSIVFAVLPSSFALILFGDWIVSLLFQRGDFTADSTLWVHATLAAYAIGAVAAASTRLFASGFHAMLDTRTPVRFAVFGLLIGTGVGAVLMWPLYAPGLAVGAAVSAWCYLLLLWHGLGKRFGTLFDMGDLVYVVKLTTACLAAGAAGSFLEMLFSQSRDVAADPALGLIITVITLGAFAVVYLGVCRALGTMRLSALSIWKGASD